MIFFSDLIRNNWAILGFLVFSAVMGFKLWKKSENGSRQWGVFVLAIPVVGEILKFHEEIVEKNTEVVPWKEQNDEWLTMVKDSGFLDRLLIIMNQEARTDESYEKVLSLIKSFGELISEYIHYAMGERNRDEAETLIREFKTQLL